MAIIISTNVPVIIIIITIIAIIAIIIIIGLGGFVLLVVAMKD